MKKILLYVLIIMPFYLLAQTQQVQTKQPFLPKWILSDVYVGLDSFQVTTKLVYKEGGFIFSKYYIKDTLVYKESSTDTIRFFYFNKGVCVKYMIHMIRCDYIQCEVWCDSYINDCVEYKIPLWIPYHPDWIKTVLQTRTTTPQKETDSWIQEYTCNIWEPYHKKKEKETALFNKRAEFIEKVNVEKTNQ